MSQNTFADFRAAMRRFIADVKKAGSEVLAWPLHDPSFSIVQVYQEGTYAVLVGVDGEGRDGTIVMPMSQLSIQMAELSKDQVEAEPEKKTFIGFIKPNETTE